MEEGTPDIVLLQLNRIEAGTNRKNYNYQCLHCHTIFENHKNAKEHVKRCKKKIIQNQSRTLDFYFDTTTTKRIN